MNKFLLTWLASLRRIFLKFSPTMAYFISRAMDQIAALAIWEVCREAQRD